MLITDQRLTYPRVTQNAAHDNTAAIRDGKYIPESMFNNDEPHTVLPRYGKKQLEELVCRMGSQTA